MKFNIMTSLSHYQNKPNNEEIRKIEYIRKNLSLDEIADSIRNGYVHLPTSRKTIQRPSNSSNEPTRTMLEHPSSCLTLTMTLNVV